MGRGIKGFTYEETLTEISTLLGVKKNKLKISIEEEYGAKMSTLFIRLLLNSSTIAYGSLVQMPGCCGLCVSTGAYVYEKYRNKGIGSIMSKIRTEVARIEGYSEIICTDIVKNTPQQKILERVGYKKLKTFVNKNTDNEIAIHSMTL